MLSEKQEKFCQAYTGEALGNAKMSAMIAGYSETYAKKADKIKNNPEVEKRINELALEQIDRLSIPNSDDILIFFGKYMADETQPMKVRIECAKMLARIKGMI